jgi:hypothetical protein
MERELAELALQLALRLQQFHPQALRRGYDSGLVSRIDLMSFLDDAVGVLSPVGDRVDGSFEDLAVFHDRESYPLPRG